MEPAAPGARRFEAGGWLAERLGDDIDAWLVFSSIAGLRRLAGHVHERLVLHSMAKFAPDNLVQLIVFVLAYLQAEAPCKVKLADGLQRSLTTSLNAIEIDQREAPWLAGFVKAFDKMGAPIQFVPESETIIIPVKDMSAGDQRAVNYLGEEDLFRALGPSTIKQNIAEWDARLPERQRGYDDQIRSLELESTRIRERTDLGIGSSTVELPQKSGATSKSRRTVTGKLLT